MRVPLHIHKAKLCCNRCNKDVHKHHETIVKEEEVYCIYCDNWLCGEYDAFGDVELNKEFNA